MRKRARLGRGAARLETGKFERAAEDLNILREEWPDLMEPSILMGKAYYLAGNPKRAGEIFDELFDRAPSKLAAALGISTLYYSLGEYRGALEWTDKLPDGHIKERSRTLLLMYLGSYDQALEAGADRTWKFVWFHKPFYT